MYKKNVSIFTAIVCVLFFAVRCGILCAQTVGDDAWRLVHTENGRGFPVGVDSADFRVGKQSERWEFELGRDANLILGRGLGVPCVIDELDPVIWVKSPHVGITIGIQIVLPNTLDPHTRNPVTFLVAGSKYTTPDQWQQLNFHNSQGRNILYQLAGQTVKMLRAERNVNFDFTGCYARQLLLYVEGNDTKISVLIDDKIEVGGYVRFWNTQFLERYEYTNFTQQVYGTESLTTSPPTASLPANANAKPTTSDAKHRASTMRFDPINLTEFGLKAGSRSAFLTSVVNETQTGVVTEWSASTVQNGSSGYRLLPTNNAPNAPSSDLPYVQPNAVIGNSFGNAANRVTTVSNVQPNPIRLAAADPLADISVESPVSDVDELTIQMSDQSIRVNNREIAVRAIRYRGEPLRELWNLGFNTVWLTGKPTLELLLEARSVGIFLICSPPSQTELAEMRRATSAGTSATGGQTLPITDKLYDSVLAWNLGDQCVGDERVLNSYFQWSKELRSVDRRRSRPLICIPASGIKDYSRFVDILLLDRLPFFTSFELSNYRDWHTKLLKSLAVPDAPSWSTIQTQPDQRMELQWQLFSGSNGVAPVVTYEQMKILVQTAITSGSHGLLFESDTPLTANDPATAYRRLALELINRELDLIEEWFSKGKTVAILKSNRANIATAVLQTNRSRLLLPLFDDTNLQHAVGAATAGNVRYVVPGVPDDYDAYQLVPGGIRPLDTERVAGGTRIILDEANINSVVFFTSNPEIRSAIELRARNLGARMASIAIELSRQQRSTFETTFGSLRRLQQTGGIPERDKVPLIGMEEQESLLRLTQTDIDRCAWFFERGDFASAFLQAEKATRGVRVAARDLWTHAIRFDLQPMMTPVSLSYHNLPAFIETYNRAIGAVREQNRLISGTAENLTQWDSEWLTSTHKVDGVTAEANLTTDAARSGLGGICLEVKPTDTQKPIGYVETAPIWMSLRQGVQVKAGEMICVTGWLNVKEPITGSHDGVMIYDNIGGAALALRFANTQGWRNFAFYRIAPSDTQLELTMSVCGFGKAYFDDIEITSVKFRPNTTPIPTPPPTNVPYWQRLNPLQLIPQNWGRGQ
ncbi:MAG: hypothetical protein LBU65_15605 [Planctomycetaceae bacterium]|jgi:hypothetical protein|nr:hypothetical protein [Planctomycetaceae bacterium]